MTKQERVFKPEEPAMAVCLWAYNRCELHAGDTCLRHKRIRTATNLDEWKSLTTIIQHCKHLGENLTPKQWEHRRIGEIV